MWRFESFKHTVGSTRGIPNIHAFCVYGTAGIKMNSGFVSNGQKEMSLQLEKRTFIMKV